MTPSTITDYYIGIVSSTYFCTIWLPINVDRSLLFFQYLSKRNFSFTCDAPFPRKNIGLYGTRRDISVHIPTDEEESIVLLKIQPITENRFLLLW